MSTTEYKTLIQNALTSVHRCPICAVLDDLEFDRLSKLQYEVLHQEQLRLEIAAKGGFCAFHFRRFRKLATAKTNALLLLAILGNTATRLPLMPGDECPLCSENSVNEQGLINTYRQSLHDAPFREACDKSFGLCQLHFRRIVEGLEDRKLAESIVSLWQRQNSSLLHLLHTMATVRYFESSGEERASIPGAVERLVGRKTLGL